MRALQSLLSGFRRSSTEAIDTNSANLASSNGSVTGMFAYPPVDPGIEVRSIDDVLSAQDDLIRRIKLSYGASRETFDRDLLSLIRRYAEYVYLLPATPDNFFSLPGGLLRMGLEVAFYALQATDGQIFSGRATISHRRQLEPRWRHATFIAGLCSELHRTLSHVIVVDVNGNEWPAYLRPLSHWLHAQNSSRFFLRWMPQAQESRAVGVFALPQIIDPQTLDYLAQGNSVVIPHMLASISGMPVYREHNTLDDLVRRASALVIDSDLRSSAERYGKSRLGSHLERHLVDALRRLVTTNALWVPNADKSRVWYGEDGAYIVWPNAADDVRKLLEAEQIPGVPKAPETLLEILTDAGVVESNAGTPSTCQIFPPPGDKAIEAIRLASPGILFVAIDRAPQPLPCALARPGHAPTVETNPAALSSADAGQTIKLPPDPLGNPGSPQQDLSPQSPNAEGPQLSIRFLSSPDPRTARVDADGPAFSLAAPLRLDAGLRAALEDIVASFHRDGASAACAPTPSGLFVPVAELERRSIEPAFAIRALADASMLASSATGGTKPVMRYVDGAPRAGIVIAPRFISGFGPAALRDALTDGATHVAP